MEESNNRQKEKYDEHLTVKDELDYYFSLMFERLLQVDIISINKK